MLPLDELLVEFFDAQGTLADFVELFGVSTVSPLHSSVEFGTFGWQDKQPNLTALALSFEVRIELRTPIDL